MIPNQNKPSFPTNLRSSTRLFFALALLASLVACQPSGMIEESKANQNLLVGLVAGQASVQNSIIETIGLWKTGFYSSGNFTSNGSERLVVSSGSEGLGTWAITKDGARSAFGGENFYRIIEVKNGENFLIYQQGKGSDNNAFSQLSQKYGRIVWTEPRTTGCEQSGTRCFDYCEIDSGLNSIQDVKNSQKVANSSAVKTNGCGGFGWNHAVQITDTTTWGN